MPNRTWISGEPVSAALAALGASPGGGMNGLQLAVEIMTALKRELSLTPTIITPVSRSTIAPAARLTEPSPEIDSGIGNTEAKYWAQPTATAADPRAKLEHQVPSR